MSPESAFANEAHVRFARRRAEWGCSDKKTDCSAESTHAHALTGRGAEFAEKIRLSLACREQEFGSVVERVQATGQEQASGWMCPP